LTLESEAPRPQAGASSAHFREGEEGKFFVWTPEEIREVLGEDADAFMAACGFTLGGNFEGKNILEFVGDMDQRTALSDARRKLFEAREERVQPGRDEEVLSRFLEHSRAGSEPGW
jgi:uncharacterized protein YyaL (SSP411 family)